MLAKLIFGQRVKLSLAGVSLDTLKQYNGIGSKVKACLEKFPREVKNSVKQNNTNQIFDNILLAVKNSDSKTSKKVECWITNNIYLVHQAVHSLGELLLSIKQPKFYVSVQNFKKNL